MALCLLTLATEPTEAEARATTEDEECYVTLYAKTTKTGDEPRFTGQKPHFRDIVAVVLAIKIGTATDTSPLLPQRPMQTDATLLGNNTQHCWATTRSIVGPKMLRPFA